MSKKERPSAAPRYTKAQFLASRQRSGRDKDILSVVLADGQTYTLAEADKALQQFLKGRVK